MIGFPKRLLDIAVAQLLVVVLAVIDELVVGIGFVDHRRARCDCLFDIEHVRENFPLDADLVRGGTGLLFGIRDDGRDRLALVGNLVGAEHGLVIEAEVEQAQQGIQIDRDIATKQHATHAGHAFGFGRIDRTNARMMVGTAGAAQVQQSVELMVVVVRRATGDMTKDVLAPCRLANDVEVVVALVGKNFLAKFNGHLVTSDASCRRPGSNGWQHRELLR